LVLIFSGQPKPKFDLKASLSKGMPNTKVGPKVAIPPVKPAAAPAAAASPAKPVKSPIKKAAITRVTAGPHIHLPRITSKRHRVFTTPLQATARGNLQLQRKRQPRRGWRPTGAIIARAQRVQNLTNLQAEEQRRASQRPGLSHHVNSSDQRHRTALAAATLAQSLAAATLAQSNPERRSF
jgi:hypothetical protein